MAASPYARGLAAQAWATVETCGIIMNPVLAEAFANIIDKVRSKPYLGNAKNHELIEELRTRLCVHGHLHPDYHTTMTDEAYTDLGEVCDVTFYEVVVVGADEAKKATIAPQTNSGNITINIIINT